MTDMTTPEPADLEGIPLELQQTLASPAVWAQPPRNLEQDALSALRAARATAHPATRDRTRNGRLVLWFTAAAAAVTIGVLTWTIGTDGPDSTLALSGTKLAPSAFATADITEKPSGFEVVLDIENLPPAAAGTYYQAWLKDSRNTLVTIGTFHARESGQGIVLWSGVDPDNFDQLTVTLQRTGEGADSSGDVVLSGTLP